MSSILIVDDEAGVRASLAGVLRDEGYTVDDRRQRRGLPRRRSCGTAYDVDPARHLAAGDRRPRHARAPARAPRRGPGHHDLRPREHRSRRCAATKLGAFDFIEKPLSLEKTVLAVRNALRQRRLEVENRALRARVDRRLRHRRRRAGDGAAAGTDRDGRAVQRPRADLGRERHRQGARRAPDPRARAIGTPGRSSR